MPTTAAPDRSGADLQVVDGVLHFSLDEADLLLGEMRALLGQLADEIRNRVLAVGRIETEGAFGIAHCTLPLERVHSACQPRGAVGIAGVSQPQR